MYVTTLEICSPIKRNVASFGGMLPSQRNVASLEVCSLPKGYYIFGGPFSSLKEFLHLQEIFYSAEGIVASSDLSM